MCDAVEKYAEKIGRQERAEGREEGRTEGRAEGRAEGRENERILSIKNIMKKLQYTAEQAMELLEIPVNERSKYLTML